MPATSSRALSQEPWPPRPSRRRPRTSKASGASGKTARKTPASDMPTAVIVPVRSILQDYLSDSGQMDGSKTLFFLWCDLLITYPTKDRQGKERQTKRINKRLGNHLRNLDVFEPIRSRAASSTRPDREEREWSCDAEWEAHQIEVLDKQLSGLSLAKDRLIYSTQVMTGSQAAAAVRTHVNSSRETLWSCQSLAVGKRQGQWGSGNQPLQYTWIDDTTPGYSSMNVYHYGGGYKSGCGAVESDDELIGFDTSDSGHEDEERSADEGQWVDDE